MSFLEKDYFSKRSVDKILKKVEALLCVISKFVDLLSSLKCFNLRKTQISSFKDSCELEQSVIESLKNIHKSDTILNEQLQKDSLKEAKEVMTISHSIKDRKLTN